MKIATAHQDVAIHGNFQTSDFNVGDVAFIVDMFADKVYTHKERAVIRELSCNAHDSHVMANTKDIPFNVHLPTTLEPWFSVRDFGTGLSDHEIRTIFAGIGISTKRNSNEVIGCFGIGSLSPYSLADSFSVTSYHNGIARSYTCYRDDQRKPVVALLTETETCEPNGLEVSVSVNGRVEEFEEEAVNVFKFWEGTLPNINNRNVIAQCEEQRKELIFTGDDFAFSASYGNLYAIMGNIAYQIPSELTKDLNCKGYLKFNLGELEFDTARENLSMTDKVKSAVVAKIKKVRSSIAKLAREQIEAQPTQFEQAAMAETFRCGNIGYIIKLKDSEYRLPEPKEQFTYYQSRWGGVDKYNSKHIPVGPRVTYFVHKERMLGRIKNRLKELGSGYTFVVFNNQQQADECGVPSHMLSDLNDLPKVERTKTSTGKVNTLKTYQFVSSRGYRHVDFWTDLELKIDGAEIVYVPIERYQPVGQKFTCSNYSIRDHINLLKEYGIDVCVFGLTPAFLRSTEFRNSTGFITFDEFICREITKLLPVSRVKYESDLNKLRDIHNIIQQDELDNIVAQFPTKKQEALYKLADRLNLEVQAEDCGLDKMIDAWREKYCMINLVDAYDINKYKHTVATYLGGKVR